MATWWYLLLPHATVAIRVENGIVTKAPPIVAWMHGKRWTECKAWARGNGGHGEPL